MNNILPFLKKGLLKIFYAAIGIIIYIPWMAGWVDKATPLFALTSIALAIVSAGLLTSFRGLLTRPKHIDGVTEWPQINQTWALFFVIALFNAVIGLLIIQ